MQTFVKAGKNMKYLQGTYVINSRFSLHLFAVCYSLFLFSSLRCLTAGVNLTPADTFCCLSAAEFDCDIIPGNVNLIWDKADLCFFIPTTLCVCRKHSRFDCIKHSVFSWINDNNWIVFFFYVASHANFGQHYSKTNIVFCLLKYSPSTHEGWFLVVPATFPGRQEHLTVCDRSSIRFLLQHRWAATTSHVPPSDEKKKKRRKNDIGQMSWDDQTGLSENIWTPQCVDNCG